ncbi:DUF3352 domain-containing protein [Patescibacteria group bacterium]|nr:DUF3352 domain-containing protein [Patescibacteria group bacterium]MBU1703712.1 DUF3352 domain-containing protein [Patescibacteria group bacterium]MBU1953535.1 DUF3352 domain-containing protein [Patescibacteria group bacterium]
MANKKRKTVASTKKVEKKAENIEEVKAGKPKKSFLIRKKNKPEKKKAITTPKAEEKETQVAPAEPAQEPVKEQKTGHRPKLSPVQKQKIRGGILMLIGLATLIFVGTLLFGKLFRPQQLADLLPNDNAVALLEIDTDGSSAQVKQFFELMKNYPVFQRTAMTAIINAALSVDSEKEIQPWLGRRVGLAIIAGRAGGSLDSLIFIESAEHNMTLEYMQKHAPTFFEAQSLAPQDAQSLTAPNPAATAETPPPTEIRPTTANPPKIIATDIEGIKIYEYENGPKIGFTFINNYLVLAPSKENIQDFASQYISADHLSADPYYRKVAGNLPQGAMIFAYIDYQKLFSALEKNETFVAQKGQDLLALKPFLSLFRAEGLTVFAEGNRFVAQTFTALDKEILDGENYITFSEKYEGRLLDLVDEEPIFLAGGHDLTKELNRVEDIFKSGTKAPAMVFDGLIEAQKQKYFGSDIGLKEDIYPLFTGEYLAVIENSLEQPVVSLLLELKDNATSVSLFDKIVNEFVKVSGVFTPRIQEVTLPDGTVGKEIVASPEKIERSTGQYKNVAITSLKLGETGIKVHYAILDNIVAISTGEDTLQRMIDRHEGDLKEGLTSGKYYERNLKPVLTSADEIIEVKLGALTQMFGLNENSFISPYLVPFNNFTVTKNFFEDGISTTYLVEII